MIAPDPLEPRKERIAPNDPPLSPDLPFRVELWDEGRSAVERVVARAHSATLAQAIFQAACEQYPGRRLSLWRDREQISEAG